MRIFLAAFSLATPVFAQPLDPRYEDVGRFDGIFGTTSLSLSALYDTEKDRSMVKLRDASGFATLSISARMIDDDGKPAAPSISFTIGPIGAGGSDVRSDIFYFDTSGYYVTDNDIGGRVGLSDYQQSNTSVSFSFAATLQPVKRGGDGFIVDDTRTNQRISGNFTGTLTDVD